MDHYLTFLEDAPSIDALNAFWRDNVESAQRIEQYSKDSYIELLGAFKKRKDEIKGAQ